MNLIEIRFPVWPAVERYIKKHADQAHIVIHEAVKESLDLIRKTAVNVTPIRGTYRTFDPTLRKGGFLRQSAFTTFNDAGTRFGGRVGFSARYADWVERGTGSKRISEKAAEDFDVSTEVGRVNTATSASRRKMVGLPRGFGGGMAPRPYLLPMRRLLVKPITDIFKKAAKDILPNDEWDAMTRGKRG